MTQSTAELVERIRHEARCFDTDGGADPEADAGTARLLREAATALEAQQARIERLEAALRPFAVAADDAERMAGHDGPLGQYMYFTDLDAARSALKEVTGE